jgi:hypothetical protein
VGSQAGLQAETAGSKHGFDRAYTSRRPPSLPLLEHLELLFSLARLALPNRPNAGDGPSWNQVSEPIVTTGLIAGSDLVIVPFSGVIKKYK